MSSKNFGQNLQSEDCAGQRRAEAGAKLGCNAGSQHQPAVVGIQIEPRAELLANGAANLYRSARRPGRTAKEMGDHRARKHQGSHTPGKPAPGAWMVTKTRPLLSARIFTSIRADFEGEIMAAFTIFRNRVFEVRHPFRRVRSGLREILVNRPT